MTASGEQVHADEHVLSTAEVLASFTGEELLALAGRRLDAEARHDWEIAALTAEAFWTEVESDPDTNAAFDRLVAARNDERRRPAQAHDPISHPDVYGLAALAGELEWLADAAAGERNQRLNIAAFKLGQHVGQGRLPADQVIDALFDAGEALGLAGWEIKATIRSGLDAGIRRPRQ
jgi:hypothetical protein